MNGSVQGYEDTYRVVDARETSTLRSQRLSSFLTEQAPFHIRNESVPSSRRNMTAQLNDFDALFAAAGNRA
ncbi:hypothetical protein EG329_000284 [Mollisiaceae sp. DMI_Dod_QoI]|nr:hypothetical protein EG329_000284 [Helotiales sp. DMI_Dod_QoI]